MTHQHDGESERETSKSVATAKAEGMNEGITVLAYLISGVGVYGLLGWLGDRYFSTSFLLPIGIVLGAATGVYVVIRRFGQLGRTADSAGRSTRNTPSKPSTPSDKEQKN